MWWLAFSSDDAAKGFATSLVFEPLQLRDEELRQEEVEQDASALSQKMSKEKQLLYVRNCNQVFTSHWQVRSRSARFIDLATFT